MIEIHAMLNAKIMLAAIIIAPITILLNLTVLVFLILGFRQIRAKGPRNFTLGTAFSLCSTIAIELYLFIVWILSYMGGDSSKLAAEMYQYSIFFHVLVIQTLTTLAGVYSLRGIREADDGGG